MIGGGQGAFIGAVHRMAAALDNQIELVCGAFSSTPKKSYASGKELYLPENRVYANFEEMILKEKALPVSERMDFVSIVTPNHMHFPPAKMALENGFHVICDKPLSFNLDQAIELESLVNKTKLVFALTHNYTGYPMVKQARQMIMSNTLGNIRKVVVEYPQGWLSDLVEQTGQKQSLWRTDPEKSGAGGSIGDIGTHAANLAEYISGLEISEICADLTTFVKGRKLDDDVNILLHFNNGAKGIFLCSQVCAGEDPWTRTSVRPPSGAGQEKTLDAVSKDLFFSRSLCPQNYAATQEEPAKRNLLTPSPKTSTFDNLESTRIRVDSKPSRAPEVHKRELRAWHRTRRQAILSRAGRPFCIHQSNS